MGPIEAHRIFDQQGKLNEPVFRRVLLPHVLFYLSDQPNTTPRLQATRAILDAGSQGIRRTQLVEKLGAKTRAVSTTLLRGFSSHGLMHGENFQDRKETSYQVNSLGQKVLPRVLPIARAFYVNLARVLQKDPELEKAIDNRNLLGTRVSDIQSSINALQGKPLSAATLEVMQKKQLLDDAERPTALGQALLGLIGAVEKQLNALALTEEDAYVFQRDLQ